MGDFLLLPPQEVLVGSSVQVKEHADSWDTSRCSLPAKLAWNASRAAWSLIETSKDVREDAGKVLGKGKGNDDGRRQVRVCVLHQVQHYDHCPALHRQACS